ncbi:hypothetical protein ACS0TY_021184 [Phlomoides rotata]
MANPSSPLSLKHRLKQTLCFSCCFGRRHDHHLPLHHSPSSDENPTVIWVETTGSDNHSLSGIKEKCCTIFGISGPKHKRHSSAVEFRYDPLSYALNFEDGFDYDDEAPLKSFAVRLPPSPSVPSSVA